MRAYESGAFSIVRDAYGIDHGLEFGLWHNGQLVDSRRTLSAVKRLALAEHGVPLDSWCAVDKAARLASKVSL